MIIDCHGHVSALAQLWPGYVFMDEGQVGVTRIYQETSVADLFPCGLSPLGTFAFMVFCPVGAKGHVGSGQNLKISM